jgi:hypothetical protein
VGEIEPWEGDGRDLVEPHDGAGNGIYADDSKRAKSKDKSDKLNKIMDTYDKRDVTVVDGKKDGETMTYIIEGKKLDLVIPTDLKSDDSFEA